MRHLRLEISQQTEDEAPAFVSGTRLQANECCVPWSTRARALFADVARTLEFNRYPEISSRGLRQVIAIRHAIDIRQVVVGNGSAELLGLLFGICSGSRAPVAVVPVPTFAMFEELGRAYGYEVRAVPLANDFDLDMPRMCSAVGGAALCVIARPNNPTGSVSSEHRVKCLIERFPETLFVIDEAYVDYWPDCSWLGKWTRVNQVHVRSLSKVGLAGLRIGYLVGPPEVVQAVDRLRAPYNVSSVTSAFAQVALTVLEDERQAMIRATVKEREKMRVVLQHLPGATVYPSKANMFLVGFSHREQACSLSCALARHNIYVRDASGDRGMRELGIAGCLRVGVGTAQDTLRLQRAIAEIRGSDSLR